MLNTIHLKFPLLTQFLTFHDGDVSLLDVYHLAWPSLFKSPELKIQL